MKTIKRTKILPDRIFHKLWDEAVKCEDSNSFIWTFSNPLSEKCIQFKEKYDIDIVTTVYLLNRIYEMAHFEFREILELAEKKQADVSHIFCIPTRTVQDWYSGKNKCPSYVILMLLKQFHLFQLSKYVKLQSEIEFYRSKPNVYDKQKNQKHINTGIEETERSDLDYEEYAANDSLQHMGDEEKEEMDEEDLWFLDRLNSIKDSTDEVDRLVNREIENETVKDLLKRTEYLDRFIR